MRRSLPRFQRLRPDVRAAAHLRSPVTRGELAARARLWRHQDDPRLLLDQLWHAVPVHQSGPRDVTGLQVWGHGECWLHHVLRRDHVLAKGDVHPVANLLLRGDLARTLPHVVRQSRHDEVVGGLVAE